MKKYYPYIIGALIGAGAGFAYYYFVGCGTDSCAIRSNPFISIIFGLGIGLLLADLFRRK